MAFVSKLLLSYVILYSSGVHALADTEYKACWNIQLQDESMFCFGAVTWPIDEENYYNAQENDALAKKWYRALLFKWYSRKNPDQDEPTNDCLAIARSIYCAKAFPKCVSFEKPKQPLCTFMCDLYLERCPNENQDLVCSTMSDEALACSKGMKRYASIGIAGLVSILSLVYGIFGA